MSLEVFTAAWLRILLSLDKKRCHLGSRFPDSAFELSATDYLLATASNLTIQGTSSYIHVVSYEAFVTWESSKNKLISVRIMSGWVISGSLLFLVCAIGSLIVQKTFCVYVCDKISFLESYVASCCIVSLNVVIITSHTAFSELEMAIWRDWLNKSRILAAFVTFIETWFSYHFVLICPIFEIHSVITYLADLQASEKSYQLSEARHIHIHRQPRHFTVNHDVMLLLSHR